MNSKTTRSIPEPTTSAMTKQVGNLPPADGDATRTMQGTARGSNEQQTGVTEYEVLPGHTVRARGRDYTEGQMVPLSAADGARLVQQGRIKGGTNRTDNPLATHLDANAPEVIEAVESGTFDADTLAQLAELETAGKGRKTVLEAIEAARAGAQE